MSTNPANAKNNPPVLSVDEARKCGEADKARAIKEAVEILRGKRRTPADILATAQALGKHDEFGYARRILDRARRQEGVRRDAELYRRIVEKSALYTYKDSNYRLLEDRLAEALKILEDEADLANTRAQETLGLAGAIYKRLWEADRKESNLIRSLYFYEKGYEQGPENDQGYTGVNAAYVSDLLAYLELSQNPNADVAARRQRAKTIRENLIRVLPPLIEEPLVNEEKYRSLPRMWFYYGTLGEAHFGLGDYERALEWLVDKPRAAGVHVPEWEFESTALQLASLARVGVGPSAADAEFERSPEWKTFEAFLGGWTSGGSVVVNSQAVRESLTGRPGLNGKIGLALSGGGFRASLFHIGVLARLAELGVLRRVEVISCVSGGSIVGAHYYLKVQQLIETTPDEQITDADYLRIVKELEAEFLSGIQRNIRARVATSFSANLKMIFKPGYSRTLRLGELYEEELYSKVADRPASERRRERYMHELVISPDLGGGRRWENFKPKFHNWRRTAKAPILVINAAALNTGHNWQFTATYMGESPASIHTEIDSVYRLRRKSYTDEPDSRERPQRVRLGHAVAASSCVPVLFEPVVLKDLYERKSGDSPEEISVGLVDGGVCDNQGVASLLEQDCTVLLVSDGSGQMEAVGSPGTESLLVALRSNNILQARIRGTQYNELDARLGASLLRGLMFVHLKKDLDNSPVDWRGCPAQLKVEPVGANDDMTSYGVARDVQQRLAQIRTDLDTFCDIEACALEASAYRMTEAEFADSFGPLPSVVPNVGDWEFLKVEPAMNGASTSAQKKHLLKVLETAGSLAFKAWRLSPVLVAATRVLIILGVGAVVAALGFLILGLLRGGEVRLVSREALEWLGGGLTLRRAAAFVLALVVVALLAYLLGRLLGVARWLDAFARIGVGWLILLLAYPAALIHLWLFDGAYIRCGKLARVLPPDAAGGFENNL
jgi:predicted acylesterase/phospholipase RssA